MTIIYPATLPLPQRDAYEIRHVSPFMRSELDTGRARQRRKYTTTPSNIRVKFIFTAQQGITFEEWFNDVLTDGASWFNILLRTESWFEDFECRFMEMYDGPALKGRDHWEFTAELETRNRTSKQFSAWGILPWTKTDATSIFDIAMNREWPL